MHVRHFRLLIAASSVLASVLCQGAYALDNNVDATVGSPRPGAVFLAVQSGGVQQTVPVAGSSVHTVQYEPTGAEPGNVVKITWLFTLNHGGIAAPPQGNNLETYPANLGTPIIIQRRLSVSGDFLPGSYTTKGHSIANVETQAGASLYAGQDDDIVSWSVVSVSGDDPYPMGGPCQVQSKVKTKKGSQPIVKATRSNPRFATRRTK